MRRMEILVGKDTATLTKTSAPPPTCESYTTIKESEMKGGLTQGRREEGRVRLCEE